MSRTVGLRFLNATFLFLLINPVHNLLLAGDWDFFRVLWHLLDRTGETFELVYMSDLKVVLDLFKS